MARYSSAIVRRPGVEGRGDCSRRCPRHGAAVDGELGRTPREPAWAQRLSPGALDRRVLDQSRVWVTAEASVVPLADMSTAHL